MELRPPTQGATPPPHTHPISDVVGLQAALDGKAALAHTHLQSEVVGLEAALDAKAALSHSHPQSDVTGLVAALAGKSDTGHTHDASEITSGILAIARVASGTPTGSKFVRDDSTLQDVTAVVAAPFTGNQAPGSFTVADGKFALHGKTLALVTSERATLEGSARLIICG